MGVQELHRSGSLVGCEIPGAPPGIEVWQPKIDGNRARFDSRLQTREIIRRCEDFH